MKNSKVILAVAAFIGSINFASAHSGAHLHLSNRWKECSIQLDPSLTQDQWHQFTREAGLVTYFRSLTDARPFGAGRFELSVLQWNTGIEETDDAWNNTFVHPNEEHWLIGGDNLPFPGLMLRAGISSKVDVAAYWSKRPGANYGVGAVQVQYNLINDTARNWALSTRASIGTLYGPADVNFYNCGLDVLASKTFKVIPNWLTVSPYAGISSYGAWAHEKSPVVDLKDEQVSGLQVMAGAVAEIKCMRLGIEYNAASVNTFSYKLGVNIKL